MKISIHPLGPDLNLQRIPIDRELTQRLRGSFQTIAASADAFTDRFYERLFAAAPAVRPLFPADMQAQKQKLFATLASIVENLEAGAELKNKLRELGQRHDGYGAQATHYPIVANAMLAAMADVAGPAWNRDIEADWRTAIERMAALMLGRG
jgi:hemoglobin-like flavoprotein